MMAAIIENTLLEFYVTRTLNGEVDKSVDVENVIGNGGIMAKLCECRKQDRFSQVADFTP